MTTFSNNDQQRARVMLPYPATSLGGVETFTCSIVSELVDLVDKTLWVLPDNLLHLTRSVPHSERLLVESFTWPVDTWQARVDCVTRGLLRRLKKTQSPEIGQWLSRHKLQLRLQHLATSHAITHCLFTSPLGHPVPRLTIPIIAVIHDWSWRRFPENFFYTSPAQLDSNAREWIKAAAAIITPSASVQQEINEVCPEFASKIRVVPEASRPANYQPHESSTASHPTDSAPIFYYPGSALAYKGHLSLFRAALRLASAGHHFKVVLTGWNTRLLTGYEPSPIPQIEQCRTFYLQHKDALAQHVEALDYCERNQVERLYRSSRRVVLPSNYEGFGLPLIEAIVRGSRVICSDIQPYQEQIDRYGCANFVDVYHVDDFHALASLMEHALLNPDPQRLLPSEAESIAHRWTWSDAARAIVSVLQETTAPGK